MDPSRRFRLFLTAFVFLLLGFPIESPSFSPSQSTGQDVLEKVKSALWDPEGREFAVLWTYGVGDDVWTGDGSLKILGQDYLRLALPHQEILIQESVVMTWFRETDQVIIDRFDRNDPGNIFSLLLGELNRFRVIESKRDGESAILLELRNETLIGFEELEISVDPRSWLPISILAKVDEEMTMRIEVVDSGRLENPGRMRASTLEGSEVIDLRE